VSSLSLSLLSFGRFLFFLITLIKVDGSFLFFIMCFGIVCVCVCVFFFHFPSEKVFSFPFIALIEFWFWLILRFFLEIRI